MEKWLLVFICFVSISSFCLVRLETIETWGELKNVRAIDHRIVTAHWIPLKVHNLMVTIPSVNDLNMCCSFDFIIYRS